MQVALHTTLKPGHEEAYLRDHETIPPDLVATFARIGIRDWKIWRSGRDLFHLVECDDFVAAMEALPTDPADQKWQAFINEHVAGMVTFGDGPAGFPMPQVWTLADQIAGHRDA